MTDQKKSNTVLDERDSKGKTGYAVKDIYMAAYLMAIGHKLEKAVSDGYQAQFYFKEVPSRDFLVYYNDEWHENLTPKKLFNAFQDCRRVSRQVRAIDGSEDD